MELETENIIWCKHTLHICILYVYIYFLLYIDYHGPLSLGDSCISNVVGSRGFWVVASSIRHSYCGIRIQQSVHGMRWSVSKTHFFFHRQRMQVFAPAFFEVPLTLSVYTMQVQYIMQQLATVMYNTNRREFIDLVVP